MAASYGTCLFSLLFWVEFGPFDVSHVFWVCLFVYLMGFVSLFCFLVPCCFFFPPFRCRTHGKCGRWEAEHTGDMQGMLGCNN